MKRHEWLSACIGALLLALGSYLIHLSRPTRREILLDDPCHSPVYLLQPETAQSAGAVVAFHGLSANRQLMQTIGQRFAATGVKVYLVDSPGHGDSTEPFSFARTEPCAVAVLESLTRRGEITPERTVLVGHSMGGGVAIRLADYFPAAATIAISPSPMVRPARMPLNLIPFPLPRRMPVNLLVVRGGWEPWRPVETDAALLRAADGERYGPEDFRQRRAMKLEHISRATHISLIFDQRVTRLTRDWTNKALNGGLPTTGILRGSSFLGGALGLAGILLALPLAASSLTALFRTAQAGSRDSANPGAGRMLLAWAVAALFAAGVLKFWVPLRFLGLFNGDYLASFFLLTGMALLTLMRKEATSTFQFKAGALAAGCGLGLMTVLALGAWLNWQLTDAWMNGGRWLRFVPIVVACLPYFAAEELALGSPDAGRRSRFGIFLLIRAILWLVLLLALFILGSGQVLVLLLAVYMAAISLLQRWCADMIRRRTGSALGAALCQALLAAWFVAAVFPVT